MSIEKNWQQLNERTDEDLASLLQPGLIQKIQSADPLLKIKSNLRFSIAWAMLFSLLYIAVLLYYPYWQIMIGIGTIFLFTLWGSISSYRLYRRIDLSATVNNSLLATMEKHYTSIQQWMDVQMKAAIFVYPAGCLGGGFVGLVAGSGKSLEYMLAKPGVLVWLIIITAFIVPCGLYLAKRLLYKSYGRHMIVLKANIDELKSEK